MHTEINVIQSFPTATTIHESAATTTQVLREARRGVKKDGIPSANHSSATPKHDLDATNSMLDPDSSPRTLVHLQTTGAVHFPVLDGGIRYSINSLVNALQRA